MASTLRERLVWQDGAIRDGDIRYLMLRDDVLMGMFRALAPEARATALQALADAVAVGGRASAERYQSLGAAEADTLRRVIMETAPQLGWGQWDLQLAESRLSLTVANSPFVSGYGAAESPVCAPICGMLTALGPLLLGGDLLAREVACAATGAQQCRFEAEVKPGS